MGIFKKRETAVQNIAYMAIMAAINLLFVLISNLLPVLLLLLVFILPLTSTIVTVFCKKRYYPIYFLATLGLCLAIAGGFNIFDTIVYVFPSLITGFIFGLTIEKQLPAILTITINTVVQFCLSILTLYVLEKIITNLSYETTLVSIFGLSDFAYKHTFAILFIYIISLIQTVLAYVIIVYEINKFQITVNLSGKYSFVNNLIEILSGSLAILSYFFYKDWALIFVLIPLPIFVYQIIKLSLARSILNYVLLGASILIFAFMFSFLYAYVSSPNQLILVYILIGLVTIIDFFTNYCFNKNPITLK